jgi:hypothetical protein
MGEIWDGLRLEFLGEKMTHADIKEFSRRGACEEINRQLNQRLRMAEELTRNPPDDRYQLVELLDDALLLLEALKKHSPVPILDEANADPTVPNPAFIRKRMD